MHSDGPLSVKKAEIVLKGAHRWTLEREKMLRLRRTKKGIKVITNKQKKLVYVIDGERYYGEAAATALQENPSTNNRSVKVLREGSPEAHQYGEDVSVMIITTDRKKKADNETVTVRY